MSLISKKRQETGQSVAPRAYSPDPFEALVDWGTRPFDLPSFFAGRLPELFRNGGAPVFPPLNVSEDRNGYDVTIEMPGLEEKDIQVEVYGRQLVVTAERTWKHEDEQKQYHRVESHYGSMQRSVALPDDAQLDLGIIDARYAKGVLSIRVPKVEPTPKRKIEVKGE